MRNRKCLWKDYVFILFMSDFYLYRKEEKQQNIGISLFSVVVSVFHKYQEKKILANSVFTEYTTQTISLLLATLLSRSPPWSTTADQIYFVLLG